jgi:hypothetical protein
MRRVSVVVLLVVAVQFAGASAQDSTNWSGAWTSRPERDVQGLSTRPGSGSATGWSGFVEALLATRDYRIRVAHTPDGVAITFPGGNNNMLTLPETPLGTEPSVRVVARGDWWTKYVSTVRVAGDVVDVVSTTSSGWWTDGDPAEAGPKVTDLLRRYTMAPGGSPDQLVLRVSLSDEKGHVEYRQVFRRDG